MLSPEELLEARKKIPAVIPSMGEKVNYNSTVKVDDSQLEAYFSSREMLLGATRVKMKGALLKGVWHDDRNEAEVDEIVGVSLMHRGHTINSKTYLYPEEALFLVDVGSLELFYNGVPMSLQKAYYVLLNDKTGVNLNQYRVYSHLSVLGYKVTRFSDSDISKEMPNLNQPESIDSFSKEIPIIIEEGCNDSQILKRLREIGPERSNCHANHIKGDYVISSQNKRKSESFFTERNLVVRILSNEDTVPDMMEMSNQKADGSSAPVLYAIAHPDSISFFLSSAVNIPTTM